MEYRTPMRCDGGGRRAQSKETEREREGERYWESEESDAFTGGGRGRDGWVRMAGMKLLHSCLFVAG